MANYPDLFTIENNNNSESLFAFQWVPGLNSSNGNGVINTQQAYEFGFEFITVQIITVSLFPKSNVLRFFLRARGWLRPLLCPCLSWKSHPPER